MSDYLYVWYQKQHVGRLWQNIAGMIGFCYEKSWIKRGFPISQQLSLSPNEYSPESGKAHKFFVNLLPEADARMHIVRALKISNSDFELLKAIGGECAGALSILPSDYKPSEALSYRELSDEELKRILLRKGVFSGLTSNENRPRLSLAGAQDKCPIFFDNGTYSLPLGASPSTHILKFEIIGYRNIPVYEYFMMNLAQAVGLSVAQTQLQKNNKDYYLLIKRYDRIFVPHEQVQRLHQEDFCQALGIGYDKKYQHEGGPSFQDCYRLIQQVSINPINDSENLLQWQIFNVLAGNSDGHAKNLSLIYKENDQAELAPFYDLVCTRAIEGIDTNLAMSIGGEFNPDKISLGHWRQMALDCGVHEEYLKEMIQNLAQALFTKISIEGEFESLFRSYPALQRVRKVIHKQCQRTLKQFSSP